MFFVNSPDGYLYEKQAILEYILHQKKEIAKKMKVRTNISVYITMTRLRWVVGGINSHIKPGDDVVKIKIDVFCSRSMLDKMSIEFICLFYYFCDRIPMMMVLAFSK